MSRTPTKHYQHQNQTRINIPGAPMSSEGNIPKAKRSKYAYSPHLSPVLRVDPTRRADQIAEIVEKACRGEALNEEEQTLLRAMGKSAGQPWLEWASKREEESEGELTVDPVALHMHERISAQAVVRHAEREDVQLDLFGDPQQNYTQAVQFYRHDVDWANRLILGDSLQVMSSLAHRENLAGKVQMIYMDPPYGIKFSSNFQVEVGRREVKDKAADLTRQPEMIKAYRDTWELGVHSYLSYLRDRLLVARDLLSDSGSCFLQISDENVHLVRCLMDEVFGSGNFMAQISFSKSAGGLQSASRVGVVLDYVVWYAKDAEKVKYRPVYEEKADAVSAGYTKLELSDGTRRSMTSDEKLSSDFPEGSKPYMTVLMTKPGPGSKFVVKFNGRNYDSGNRWWGTTPQGIDRVIQANSVEATPGSIRYITYFSDFPFRAVTNLWSGFGGAANPVYVVQTNSEVVKRCILMTTDPGDLVLDPTCGSGTTAYVAEQWGRRWITMDTSRVAVSLARQRLVTAKFEHYRTKQGPLNPLGVENPGSGFTYKKVPHITLKSIAQNSKLDPIFARHEPILAEKLAQANAALLAVDPSLRTHLRSLLAQKEKLEKKKSITDADRRRWLLPPENRDPGVAWTVDATVSTWYDWEVPFDTDPSWPQALQDAVLAYRAAWRAKMEEVNRCIAESAEYEELVDQPEVESGVVRVSGPFTVEGVIPEERTILDSSIVDYTPDEFESEEQQRQDTQNVEAWIETLTQSMRRDGVYFLNNQRKEFALLERIESRSASCIHAEGYWKEDTENTALVGVSFGPEYGPFSLQQAEDAIRAAQRYSHLILAGFGFLPEVTSLAQQNGHRRLSIHLAHIRPDMSPHMRDVLKEQPHSQLFSVFGLPDVELVKKGNQYTVILQGVNIYNPVTGEVSSTGGDKVVSWMLDTDFDGRCFCATQIFFPDKSAWERIAKALGGKSDSSVFEKLHGKRSLPFAEGKHKRVAIKVIDPRGNEVMGVYNLQQAEER